MWWITGEQIWAALAHTGAWLNALNLIPVWALDGGQAAGVLGQSHRWLMLTACVALWLVLGQSIFFLVAAGTAYRLFTKDLPAQPSNAIAAYFLIVLASLGVLMWSLPGESLAALNDTP
jgi:Zn-dependent protease